MFYSLQVALHDEEMTLKVDGAISDHSPRPLWKLSPHHPANHFMAMSMENTPCRRHPDSRFDYSYQAWYITNFSVPSHGRSISVRSPF
jgi:hypothetical protein